MKKTNITLIALLVVLLVGAGAYFFWMSRTSEVPTPQDDQQITEDDPANGTDDNADEVTEERQQQEVLGTSAEGRDITAHHYGDGEDEVLFVGGIHGGYEWNTALLSYQLKDYLESNPSTIPSNVTVTVIPVVNPDGLSQVVGTSKGNFTRADVPALEETVPGRFNANGVDLNRNFDCEWETTGVWRDEQVDAGDEPFSEPESRVLRDYIEQNDIAGAVVFYSAAGRVYSSSCNSAPLTETAELMNLYANASGYAAAGEFSDYPLTGDAVNWIAKQGIPGISVLLTNHEDVEWSKNRAGVEAVLDYFAN